MSENNEKKAKGGKGGKIAFVICILVIIILFGVVFYLLLEKDDNNTKKRNVVINKKNVEEVLSNLVDEEKVATGYYEVTMNSTWYFENGAAASKNAYVKNAETNKNPVYFDVTLSDTKKTIYESPILPVGSYLENITLDNKLDTGTYDCVATYHLLDKDDKSISTVRVSLTIVIENKLYEQNIR